VCSPLSLRPLDQFALSVLSTEVATEKLYLNS